MFIKNSTCNYNAQKLLSTISILVFALHAWVALIFIMESTIILLLVEKENMTKEILTSCFGITLPLIQPTIMIQFLIILGSLLHKNPPLNIDLL
jgi:hypothetical protein